MNRGRRPRAGSRGNGSGDDFYSQMASLAGDFDSSEASSGTDLNSNSPKVDVDNLDTNLFSSLKATSTSRAAIGNTSPSPSKSAAKDSPRKKPKGVDMGELSKLLGTDDILKDLSSSKKKPTVISSLKPLQPDKPANTQIKEEADDLLDLLSTFDDSDSKTDRPKVAPSKKLDQGSGKKDIGDYTSLSVNENDIAPPTDIAEKKEVQAVQADFDYKQSNPNESTSSKTNQPKAVPFTTDTATSGNSADKPGEARAHKSSSLKSNSVKSPVVEKKSLKTAATVNFDSEDEDDDLLAGLGFDDDSSNAKKTASKKSVRFSDDIEPQPLGVSSQKQSHETSKTEMTEENLELPKFPWQKKIQQQQISVQKPAEINHTYSDKVGEAKLEPPTFPWQKKTQQNAKRKSSLDQDTAQFGDQVSSSGGDLSGGLNLKMDDLFTKSGASQSQPELHKQVTSSPADLMELGDPFAKKPSRRRSSSQSEIPNEPPVVKPEGNVAPASTESSTMQELFGLGDPFAKKTHKSANAKTEPPKISTESLLDLGDPFAKKRIKPSKDHAEPSHPPSDNALELDSRLTKKSSLSPRSSPRSIQKQTPEDILQVDDPFVKKTRSKLARSQMPSGVSSSLSSDPDDTSLSNTLPQVESGQPQGRRKVSLDVRRQGSGDDGVRLEDLQQALKRAQEAEEALEKERLEHAKSKRLLIDAETKLHFSNSELEKWKQQAEYYRSNISETEATKQSMQDELMTKLKETTLTLQKTEMEHSHAKHQLETLKKRNEDEIESIKQSYNIRIAHLEESANMAEKRWKEELQLEVARWQEKLQNFEKDKLDAVQKLQKEVQVLEAAKTQDIDLLKDMYKSTMENLKNDHEEDKQKITRRHMEEVQAIKDAQLHSRTLSELKSKVEASSKMVTELQAKLAEEHDQVLNERAQRNRAQESQLKVMEDRLFQQQTENETERGRLQGLIAKMEARISQQDRTIEQDRWTLNQEQAKLKAQQIAFREEQLQSRSRLEEDRNQFQLTREQFLVEQQNILSKCYQEQQKVAMEKAEASFRKKKAEDYEMSSRQLSQQAMAEREVSMSHLNEESMQMEVEKKKLSKLEEDLVVERRLLDTEKEKLKTFTNDVCSKSKEVDGMCKNATEMKRVGEKELKQAQQIQKEIQSQQESLKEELANLRKKEIQISEEQLEFLEQRKQFQEQVHKASMSMETSSQLRNHLEPLSSIMGFTPIPVVRQSLKLPVIDNGRHVHPADPPQSLYSSLSNAPSSPPPKAHYSTKFSLPLMQSSVIQQSAPAPTSPVHIRQSSSRMESSRSTTPEKSTSIQAYLQQLEHNVYARKDYEELEKQKLFLASLSNSHQMKL